MGRTRYFHIDVEQIIKETEAAFLIMLEDGEQHWLPKSQIANASDYEDGDHDVVMSITEWIAEQKGIA